MKMMLESARVNAGYNQSEAAKLFGIHYQTLAKLEADSSKIPYEIIRKIPQVYGVPADHIFFGPKNEFIRYIRNCAKNYSA
ncbi:helix-turn-helix transcriptional regulator [Megasphaera massiliensis]|mgnify:CR=1 FL=1|uniref:helix-turn-helix transcriptional regulator n=1 Tax=Megasphaera massiliensis TaxID=1232428 RepID=UPI0005CB6122|nr:helix-turn-helix transcriptional regulator [Megasphaera massiliensis]DAF84463.1 MAG TPA: helix-turn-helix XRE-family like protein [Caudoviricetes sp.]